MAVTRASKLVLCTDYNTGVAFYVSADKIIKFTTVIGVADTLLTYINNRDTVVTTRVTEAVATIATAMNSSTISLAVALTVINMNGITLPSSIIYVNKERLVYLDTNPSNGAYTDVVIDTNKADYERWTITSPAIGSVASENMFPVTMESNDLVRYINNLFIDQVTADTTNSSNASSATISAAGTGYVPADTITIAGGTFTNQAVFNVATTKLISAATNAAGTGYVPGNTITLAGGTFSTAAILTITHTKVITAAVVAGGASGTPGAVTITGTTGTGTKFQATGTINGGGALAGALTVTVAGDYTANPTNIAVEPVTGGGLVGCTVILTVGVLTTTVTTAGSYTVNTATFTQSATSGAGTGATFNTAVYGVNTLTVNNAGQYTDVPTNPAAQYSTSGSGTGATLTVSWGDGAQILYDNKRTGFVMLQVAESASAIATTVNAL